MSDVFFSILIDPVPVRLFKKHILRTTCTVLVNPISMRLGQVLILDHVQSQHMP